MRLHGFTNPLSPEGRSSLVEPLPHYISADAIRVLFRAGEDVARRYLPEPLEPIEDGLGYAFVADMLKVSASEPDQAYLNPERTQYGEGIVGFACSYGGQLGRFSCFIWVTTDWSMLFGQAMGWAKKMASVTRTHVNPFNPVMHEVGPGSRLKGVVHRQGVRLMEVGVTLEERVDVSEMPRFGDQSFMLRHFPAVGPAIPSTTQLLSLRLGSVQTGEVFRGVPELRFGDAADEELAALADVELLSGWTYKQGWVTEASAELVTELSELPVGR